MAVRQIFAVVGAAIGGYVGGPNGASIGYSIGSAFGNAWDPQELSGPKLGDLGAQTSQEGGPRGIIFGLSPPIAGNVIATSEPKIVKKKKSQGKGGGPVVVTEAIFRTYAIGVCEGPIKRFVRIWRNGKLVWSDTENEDLNYGPPASSTALERLAWHLRLRGNALAFEERIDLYLGTYDQEPNFFLEQIFGAGKTPAFRGTAYIMVQDEDLTDMKGAIPQYLFQVERCEGEFLTSRVYSIEDVEEMHTTGPLLRQAPLPLPEDEMHAGGALIAGDLHSTLDTYDDWPPEDMHSLGELTAGELRSVLLAYPDWPPEDMHSAGALLSGSLETKLVTYQNWPVEDMHTTGALQSGTLT